ncbi:uncharacterized protein LOC114361304 [Ostrinia furnacalis]|uniref:uncharacterized protein LOC114356551 n=1 Tax=Ostrinia furnacalis TaxID=93504 RepID=UPI00103AEEB3|nr:uncharacterized protein LOC114356551 [Ostrinia furnacalis]XP_028172098.1 uncharacterized protein LOC114361304 [Ostrinia furnacalis]
MEKEFQDAQGAADFGPTEQNGATTRPNSTEIYKVAVRVPPFWPEEPEIWFAQVEGQFSISGITADATKFNYVISQLDNKYSREVKDIIINPPATDKYGKLKAELIKRLTASNEKKLKQLMMHEELGDRKPSQFLRHLKSLAGVDVPDDFLKTIWISRLPHGVQTVLAGQPSHTSIDDLADLADRVNDLATSTPRVAAVSDVTPNVFIDLKNEIAELRRQFQNMASGRNSRAQNRSTHNSNSRSSSRQRSDSSYRKYPLCWFHGKFGEKAKKCVRPCDYKAGNATGSR